MFRRTRNRRTVVDAAPWSRARLQLMLGGLALAVVVARGGRRAGRLARRRADAPPAPVATGPHETLTAAGQPIRDEIAAAPMAAVDPQAAFHPDPATTPAASIEVPQPSILDGPAGVPTGFPAHPRGRGRPVAAIAQTVLESMSLPRTREVHTAWVQPGGPRFERVGPHPERDRLPARRPPGRGREGPHHRRVGRPGRRAGQGQRRAGLGGGLRAARRPGLDPDRVPDGLRPLLPDAVESTDAGRSPPAPNPPPAPSAWPGSKAAVAAGWLTWTRRARCA